MCSVSWKVAYLNKLRILVIRMALQSNDEREGEPGEKTAFREYMVNLFKSNHFSLTKHFHGKIFLDI